MPKDSDTLNLLADLSFMWPSLLELDNHLPCLAIKQSEMPELAASVAPPDLREWRP